MYLDVGDGHELYCELFGNPNGKKIIFLHGGPGLGCSEKDKQFFDPEKHLVIFFDQRGCGKSKPYGTFENNNTNALLNDITTILDFFQFDKAVFFGGSWGSALSLIYAIQNPERVEALILRGLFLATSEVTKIFYINDLAAKVHPIAWKKFNRFLPDSQKENINYYYDQMILQEEDLSLAKEYAFELAKYSYLVCKNKPDVIDLESLNTDALFTKLKIQSFFSSNDFFIPTNYIMDNVHEIGAIPTYIVHGKQDVICPLESSEQLHEKLENSTLKIVEGGHSSSEPTIYKALLDFLQNLND